MMRRSVDMVGLDIGTPPLIFIVGTLVLVVIFGNCISALVRFLETDAIAVNLDPGAERVHYDEFDVRVDIFDEGRRI